MPIWIKTKEKYKNFFEFIVSCDCGDFDCHKILFTYFEDPDYKELYISSIPGRYPIPMRDIFKRIKFAWNYLIHGRLVYKDSIVLHPETLESFIDKLQYTYKDMMGLDKQFKPFIYYCEEFVNFEPNKHHILITDIPEEGMLKLMREYNNIRENKFKSMEFLQSLKDRGIYIEDIILNENSSISFNDAINIDLMYANDLGC